MCSSWVKWKEKRVRTIMHLSMAIPTPPQAGHMWGRGGDLIHLIFNGPIPGASSEIKSPSMYIGSDGDWRNHGCQIPHGWGKYLCQIPLFAPPYARPGGVGIAIDRSIMLMLLQCCMEHIIYHFLSLKVFHCGCYTMHKNI